MYCAQYPWKKLLKAVYCTVMLDAGKRHRSVKMVSDVDEVSWAADPLRIHYKFWLDSSAILPSQPINLRKIVNISSAIMRREATFKVTMQSLLSYDWAFEEEYGARFVGVHRIYIVKYMMSSNFLVGNFTATFLQYIAVDEMGIKHKFLLPLHSNLDKIGPAA